MASAITSTAIASSHREAPYITKNPQVDGTDLYVFNSYEPGREGYVTFLSNYIPDQSGYAGPTYFTMDENASYDIHIDNNGDAQEDITFRFDFNNTTPEEGVATFNIGGVTQPTVLRNVGTFDVEDAPNVVPSTLAFQETYQLDVVQGNRRFGQSGTVTNVNTGSQILEKPFDYAGFNTFGGQGNYGSYADQFIHDINIPGCSKPGRVFVGQRLDGFKVALGEIFDLIAFVPIELDSAPGANDNGGLFGDQNVGIRQDPLRNTLLRSNVTTIAVEVAAECITGNGNGVIGSWATSSLRQVTVLNQKPTLEKPEQAVGNLLQVSRISNPLVNELFVGFPQKDLFNASEPRNDGQFASFVTNPVFPAIVDSIFNAPVNSLLGLSGPDAIESLAPSNFPRTDLVTAFLTGFPGVNQLSKVTPSEMLRLNTAIPATPREDQANLGVVAGDLAGFPNGRRPGDDTIDIALRVALGALCHPIALDLNGDGIAADNLGICTPADAPVGNVAFTDGAPVSALDFEQSFPYLLTPYPGAGLEPDALPAGPRDL